MLSIVSPMANRAALAPVQALLEAGAASICTSSGEVLPLPEPLVRVLRAATVIFERGDAVSIIGVGRDLTTQEAANLLNVSRTHVITLLDDGVIPSTRTGTHRRVAFDDVLAYKRNRDAVRRQMLAELTSLDKQYGLE